ncbi:alpha/beta hydrolase [Amycolatopsis minnesotensis]|uniref:Alpha/beta hydrolase n=1 Tax=Amycolatopsis minnesotensis TaxID=337894 RepID=A0ABP5C4Z6_9PSEU
MLVAVVSLGAVLPSAAAGAATRASSVKWTPCADTVGAPRDTACATLEVPLDYADPDGREITLMLYAAGNGAAPRGLVVNPGGPGESGAGMPKLITAGLPRGVSDQYMVVSFDPRGVGASSPVDCGDTDSVLPPPAPAYRPSNEQSEQQRLDAAKRVADQCAEESRDLLPHITTQNAAKDMDRIRAALGQEKLDYLGYSYGSMLGATYASLFPATTGRMILDSVVDPTVPTYQTQFQQDPALQQRSEAFFAWVAGKDARYHLGTTEKAVSDTWNAVRDQLAKQPAAGKVGVAELDDLLSSSIYSDTGWDSLAKPVGEYHGGRPDALVAAHTSHGGNVNGAQLAYNCVDRSWPKDWATWHRDTEQAARRSPLFAWLNSWYSAPCAFWKVPTAEPVPIGGAKVPPILLLQAKNDAATPVIGAQRMHTALPGSKLVVADSGNHGQYLQDNNPCVDGYGTAYLESGELPDAGKTCAAPPPRP